jgi:predicted transcriptional regulator
VLWANVRVRDARVPVRLDEIEHDIDEIEEELFGRTRASPGGSSPCSAR